MKGRWWLIGASDGLGLALARLMAEQGADVILSSRGSGLDAAVASVPRAVGVACDVSDAASMQAAAEQVGTVDGMVFLAGVYWPLSAQDWNTDHVAAMCDINLTGCARAVGAVLPQMLARGTGHIVLTGSLAGYRGLPGAVGYAASKAGVRVLAESLYADLRGSGIRVQLADPGFIHTRLTAKNDFPMPQVMTPEDAARQMLAHMQSRRFARAFPTPFAWMFRWGRILPDALWFRLFSPRAR